MSLEPDEGVGNLQVFCSHIMCARALRLRDYLCDLYLVSNFDDIYIVFPEKRKNLPVCYQTALLLFPPFFGSPSFL